MDTTTLSATDLEAVARQLHLHAHQCRATVELLDEGNTVPFITRYRKDLTGGLDEEKIRQIQEAVEHKRQLNDRRERILRSIQSQGALTPELEQRIHTAASLKILEDLYLPFRPKKQTLATLARQRGLEPLAQELLQADPTVEDLQARCHELIDPEKDLPTEAEVLAGVGHILAEVFSERSDLRSLTRRHMWSGKIVSRRVDTPLMDDDPDDDPSPAGRPIADPSQAAKTEATEPARDAEPPQETAAPSETDNPPPSAEQATEATEPAVAPEVTSARETTAPEAIGATSAEQATEATEPAAASDDTPACETAAPEAIGATSAEQATEGKPTDSAAPDDASAPTAQAATESASSDAGSESVAATAASSGDASPRKAPVAARGPLTSKSPRLSLAEERRRERREARHRKRQKLEQSFKDYFDYSEPLKRLPHYRVLAVNRGERCKVLRVKIQFDGEALKQAAEQLVIKPGQPHADLLRHALHDALARLVVPSIEREIRRELTERAEAHAVKVFAQNLRKLLLQPPLHSHRVMAIDPGFRSGCKLAVLDEFGKLLDHCLIHVIGAADRVQQSKQKLADYVRRYNVSVVALGNGTACRETEQLVADVLSKELTDREVHYLIVNEAGASVYSTSQVGREELPRCDATVRGAVSIGRRALDPLSELVKIDPASIGVGLYQHDVKGKHLRASLDAVVESCVNYVGVDVNTASPALLGYVSGLNQLTARRIYEYRQQHGPFRDRQQLTAVPGVGDATYVQAAGFLKIVDGDNPLDSTWIHPESYSVAQQVLEEIGCDAACLARHRRQVTPQETPPATAPEVAATTPPPTSGDAPAMPAEPMNVADPHVAADAPTVETPTVETPTVETPTVETPTVETPTVETPTVETPTVETPTVETPTVETPTVETPTVETPTAETPTAETPQDGVLQVDRTQAQEAEAASAIMEPVGDGAGECSAATGTADPTATPSETAAQSSTDSSSALPTAPVASESVELPDADGSGAEAAKEDLLERFSQLSVDRLAEKLSVGRLLLQDILASLARPGRDPREDLSPPVFRREILKLEDLKPGMELSGAVLNVVDFGAFVDIGLSDSGLIHVSRLADRFVSDPHEVVSVGDVVNVWVVEVDEKRRRVSLTAIRPGTERARPRKEERRPRSDSQSAPPRRKPRREQSGEKLGKGAAKSRRSAGGWQGKRKAKPAAPITDAMAEGREPMRTFSDLQQFFQRRKGKRDEPKSSGPPPSESSD